MCRNACNCNSFIVKRFIYNSICTNFIIVSNIYISNNNSTKSNINIATNSWCYINKSVISNALITVQPTVFSYLSLWINYNISGVIYLLTLLQNN